MRRYILTGTPGAGKTSVLRLLAAVGADIQVFDRSPVCTHALARYLGRPASAALPDELGRITRDQVYERQVFLIRNLGFCEPAAARRISFDESRVRADARGQLPQVRL